MMPSTPCCIIIIPPKLQEHDQNNQHYYFRQQQEQQQQTIHHQRRRRIIRKSLSLSSNYFNYCLLLLVMISIIKPIVYGFPSWLRCDVEIDDREEIIMNYYVVHPEYYSTTDVMHELVQIEIQPQYNENDNNEATKYEKPKLIDSYYSWEYPIDIISKYNIRLYIPQPSDHPNIRFASDIQYAIDIINIEYDNEDNIDMNTKYIEPSTIVCDGQRIYVTKKEDYATIQINALNTKSITIQGVWARGHEEVKLTRPFILKRSSSTNKDNSSNSNPSETEDDSKVEADEKESTTITKESENNNDVETNEVMNDEL